MFTVQLPAPHAKLVINYIMSPGIFSICGLNFPSQNIHDLEQVLKDLGYSNLTTFSDEVLQ